LRLVTTIEAGGPDPAGPSGSRLASPGTATALGALALVLTAVAITLSGLEHQLSILGSGPIIPIAVIFAGVGVVVARRQPRNPIDWILIGFIVLFLFSTVVGYYAALYYRFGHHGLPLAPVAVLLQPLWAPALVLFPVVILLFPDGRLTSRRWRWVLVAYGLLGALASVAIDAPAIAAVARHDVRLDSYGDVISTGGSHSGQLATAALVLAVTAILAIWLSFVTHQVLSWRRATGERRQQLKWLASGGAATLVVLALSFGINSTGAAGEVLGIGLAGLPVGIGVGILKYRLYDIDRIISRAVSYAIVTGLLVGLYAGLVLLPRPPAGRRGPGLGTRRPDRGGAPDPGTRAPVGVDQPARLSRAASARSAGILVRCRMTRPSISAPLPTIATAARRIHPASKLS
jgi:two-component system NarL family sensor kinase